MGKRDRRRPAQAEPCQEYRAGAPLLNNQIKRELRPAFETDVERVVVPLRIGKSEIEIAFDQGRVNTPDDHDSISEIEIELKQGRRSDMALLARRLARAFPVSYAARSKAERGYALLEGTQHAAVSARPLQVAPTMTTADGFGVIAFECLRQVAANEAAVRRSDAEGVHQMRVGLRRLRAALSLFKDMLEGRETEAIKKDLRSGRGREADEEGFDILANRCDSAFSRRRSRPSCCCNLAPLQTEGAGKTGCTLHPRSRVQDAQKKAHTSIQVQRRQSGLPCANGFNGFLRALPGDEFLLSPSSAD
jgi:inorganic triphosphatase YgiF